MKNKTIRKSRFTLIELLVVIGIIGILTGILLPAISGSMTEGKKTKAAASARQVASAVEAYLNEYGSLPKADDGNDTNGSSATVDSTLLGILGGNNARSRSFFDNTGTLKDPWNQDFRISMDGNYDNEVLGNGSTVAGSVAVWTTYDGDTIGSWEK